MAVAAEDLVELTYYQIAITGVEVGLILIAVGAAFWAAWEARKAAKATAETVVVTRKTAKRQLRAYLGVTDAYVKYIDPTHIQANITISNSGPTPANGVTRFIDAELRDPNRPGEFPVGEHHFGKQPIAPGGFWIIRKDQGISEQDLGELIKPTAESTRELFVWGSVEYTDIYKKPQTLSFRYRTHARRSEFEPERGIQAIRGWDLHPEEDGNEAK